MNEQALKIAMKVIKVAEGCYLFSYPDPASDLYKALSRHGMLQRFMRGDITWRTLPKNFQELDGNPWTLGYGETRGVTKDSKWTQAQAESALEARVKEFMAQAIKDCPNLAKQSPERIAAITSLCYNIGSSAFKNSTACKKIMANDHYAVGPAIKLWNKAGGSIMAGLVNRREVEANLYNSGK